MTVLGIFIAYALLLSLLLYFRGCHTPRKIENAKSIKPPAKILVIGASGGTGRQVVSEALERGYSVTAFVRTPDRFNLEHPNLRVHQGDVMDEKSLDKAMAGQDAVLSTLGHKRFFIPTKILSQGTANIISAMRKHGLRKFICETSLGVGDSAGKLGLYYTLFTTPVILPLYYWDKARQETLIAGSGLDWVIVRPGLLTNGNKKGAYRSGVSVGSYVLSLRIARADVAHFMLDELELNRYPGKAVGVAY